MQKILTLSLLAFLSSSPCILSAHGTEQSQTATVGAYEVRLEYDALENPIAGEATTFNFDLSPVGSEEDALFDRVFVTVSEHGGPIIFVGNLSVLDVSDVKTARARIFLPVGGQYDIALEYYVHETKLAAHTFTLTADPAYEAPESGKMSSILLWITSLVIGLGIEFWLLRRHD
jgi:hypothetical protein